MNEDVLNDYKALSTDERTRFAYTALFRAVLEDAYQLGDYYSLGSLQAHNHLEYHGQFVRLNDNGLQFWVGYVNWKHRGEIVKKINNQYKIIKKRKENPYAQTDTEIDD